MTNFQKVDIKNCTCYYFDGKIKIEDFDLDNVLIDEKPYDETKYLALCGSKKFGAIYNRIRYLIGGNSGIIYAFSHSYPKIKVDSCGSLALGKTLRFHNVIILIKSVFNKDKNNFYDNIFTEKSL